VDRARKNLESMHFADTTSRETGCLQFGSIVPSVFTPVLAKHSKSFSLIDSISVGVDRMQRNFEPMRKQAETCQQSELTDVTAKVVIYEAFGGRKTEAPKHLARTVHDLCFEPNYDEFKPRTIWSPSNAVTSAFKELNPIPQFKATAKLGKFLEARFSQSWAVSASCRSSSMNWRALRGSSTYPSIGMGISGSG